MNVNWLLVGIHYVQKKLIMKNLNLFLNFGYFSPFSKVQHLIDIILTVNFCVRLWTEVPKSCLGFLEEKLKTSRYANFGLLCTFAYQIENCSIQIKKVKDRTFRFQKNKCTCLIMTGNARNNRRNDGSKVLKKNEASFSNQVR